MTREYLYRAPHSIVFATELRYLYDNHKTNFDGINMGTGYTRHTSLDWFLVPKERPSIDKASVKEHYIDIPGANGGLDLTESLTGFPLYDYIEGSFEFTILNDRKLITVNSKCEKTKETDISWEVLNRDIREFLNGKQRYMMLEDDPSWYYVGRFTVGKYDSSDSANSKIEISYKVYPFKKLSTYHDHESNFRESYFDANPLFQGDTRNLLNSFWNKTDLFFYIGDSYTFDGSIAGQLPCGSESVSITFLIKKHTDNLAPIGQFERPDTTIETKLVTKAHSDIEDGEYIKPRGFILTNKGRRGLLYSDNKLTLSLPTPPAFDPTKPYSKGDVVSYHHVVERPLLPDVDQHITWIMIAKEDISEGSPIDLSQWEVDETAMSFKKYDTDRGYRKGDYVYIYSDTLWGPVFALIRATEHITAGTVFNPEQWSLVTDEVPMKDTYFPIRISVIYDIGVM